jgi:hypothetical protein
MEQHTHENFAREAEVQAGSERSFGLVMAVAFGALGTLNWWHAGRVWLWLLAAAAAFLAAALVIPAVLKPLNQLWHRLGLLLHRIINPIVMGVVFYGTVLPTGLIMRALGNDLLRLRSEPDRDSYWIRREPPGPKPESMRDQF